MYRMFCSRECEQRCDHKERNCAGKPDRDGVEMSTEGANKERKEGGLWREMHRAGAYASLVVLAAVPLRGDLLWIGRRD